MKLVGDNIKKLRKEKNMTQDQLAESLNVTRQAVSNWERNQTQPDLETLEQIAKVFDVSTEKVIYGKSQGKWSITIGPAQTSSAGIGLGAALAMIISYTHWQSIGWAILHGMLNWVYVLYYIIKY